MKETLPDPVLSLPIQDGPTLEAGLEAIVAGKSVRPEVDKGNPRPTLVAGEGAGEGTCLDLTASGRDRVTMSPPIFSDSALETALNGARTLTVAGWFRCDPVYDDSGHDYAFHSPWLALFFHEKGKDGGALKISGTRGGTVLWTTMHGHFVNGRDWVFYAFTYDGRQRQDNCLSYTGSDEDPVDLSWTASADIGPLRSVTDASFVVGAATADGEGTFPGYLDHIRIFASRDPEKPAILTPAQLEALRRADLGPGWSDKLARRTMRRQQERQAARQALRENHYGERLNLVEVDPLEAVFPDRLAAPMAFQGPVSAARAGTATWQFVVRGRDSGRCTIAASKPVADSGEELAGRFTTYVLKTVPVEANTNGGSRTAVGRQPPDSWMRHFIREAPFDIAEVTVESSRFELTPDVCHSVLLVADVDADAEPGLYRAKVTAMMASGSVSRDIVLQVHRTQLSDDARLHVTYWLSPDPADLTSADPPPPWWSESHWKLLENTGRRLKGFGQDCILTPVVKGQHPLVITTRKPDGTYQFEFSRFDRWVRMFKRIGFSQFHGHHVTQWGGVYGLDAKTKEYVRLLTGRTDVGFDRFLASFYTALGQHLERRGWTQDYLQHQADETGDVEAYRKLTETLRAHAPGIRTLDAINKVPEQLSELVDVPVLAVVYMMKRGELVRSRQERGLTTWFYNCCSPPPPYPNRHLDERLTNSRLYPWIAARYGATGYLNWGANIYRGADPYQTSVGPVPGGSQNPGHPPGDNWHFYPAEDGLIGGMRMVAFREGLQDYALLNMLARKNKSQADAFCQRMVRSLATYEKDPREFHAMRAELLEALDR